MLGAELTDVIWNCQLLLDLLCLDDFLLSHFKEFYHLFALIFDHLFLFLCLDNKIAVGVV